MIQAGLVLSFQRKINEIQIIMNKGYQIIENIGQGAYGSVYLIRKNTKQSYSNIKKLCDEQQLFALKCIPNKHIHLDIQAKLLPKLNHPNIISTKQIFYDEEGINFMMEYASNGDLDKHISQKFSDANKSIESTTLVRWFLQLSLGLNYLHENLRIIHRDIKMKNILVMKNGLLKLTDFGISRQLEKGQQFAQTSLGTPQCLSPQMYNMSQYDKRTDVWGLGCIMFELCTGSKPFYSSTLKELFKNIMEKQYKIIDLPHFYPLWLRETVIKMLQKDAMKRPTIHSILQKNQMRQAFQQLRNLYPQQYGGMLYPALTLLTTKNSQKDQKMLEIFSLKTAKNDNTRFLNSRVGTNVQNQFVKQSQKQQKKVEWQKFANRSLRSIIDKIKYNKS